MPESHVLVLVGEAATGERGDFYRWTFEGPVAIAGAVCPALEPLALAELGEDPELIARLREPGARWHLRCSCRWESKQVAEPRSLFVVAMLHLLAHS